MDGGVELTLDQLLLPLKLSPEELPLSALGIKTLSPPSHPSRERDTEHVDALVFIENTQYLPETCTHLPCTFTQSPGFSDYLINVNYFCIV